MSGRSSGESGSEGQLPAPREERDDVGDERGFCWVCGAQVDERHCKIICPRCGFMRDCSHP